MGASGLANTRIEHLFLFHYSGIYPMGLNVVANFYRLHDEVDLQEVTGTTMM